jgi:hypothetical protein
MMKDYHREIVDDKHSDNTTVLLVKALGGGWSMSEASGVKQK